MSDLSTNEFPEGDLAPETTRLLSQLISDLPSVSPARQPDATALISYVCGELDADSTENLEGICMESGESRAMLVRAHSAVRHLSALPITEVRTLAMSGGDDSLFAAAYLEIVTKRVGTAEGGLVPMIQRGLADARTAYSTLLAALQTLQTMPSRAGQFRSGIAGVTLEPSGTVTSTITEDELILQFPTVLAEDLGCYVSLESPSGRLRLGRCKVQDNTARLPIDGALAASGSFVVRLGDWPEGDSLNQVVCFVGEVPSAPFAHCVEPIVVRSEEIAVPLMLDLAFSQGGDLALWLGTGANRWQFVGTQRVSMADGPLTLRHSFPGPDQVVGHPIKLVWSPIAA